MKRGGGLNLGTACRLGATCWSRAQKTYMKPAGVSSWFIVRNKEAFQKNGSLAVQVQRFFSIPCPYKGGQLLGFRVQHGDHLSTSLFRRSGLLPTYLRYDLSLLPTSSHIGACFMQTTVVAPGMPL